MVKENKPKTSGLSFIKDIPSKNKNLSLTLKLVITKKLSLENLLDNMFLTTSKLLWDIMKLLLTSGMEVLEVLLLLLDLEPTEKEIFPIYMIENLGTEPGEKLINLKSLNLLKNNLLPLPSLKTLTWEPLLTPVWVPLLIPVWDPLLPDLKTKLLVKFLILFLLLKTL